MKWVQYVSFNASHSSHTLRNLKMISILSIDPALGRLDYDSLSDQALMEMLVEGIAQSKKAEFQDTHGNYRDTCDWNGTLCKDERVTGIVLSWKEFGERQFPFDVIPPLVERFIMKESNLHGTLDTFVLPRALTDFFDIASNKLHGSVSFVGFPRSLKRINLNKNAFSGSCNLENLPDALLSLQAKTNQFSGEISLNALPAGMTELRLSYNNLTGPIHIEKLPERMGVLGLSRNGLTGDFVLRTLPEYDLFVYLHKNAVSGTAILPETSGKMRFSLLHDFITTVVDTHGKKHRWEQHIIKDCVKMS